MTINRPHYFTILLIIAVGAFSALSEVKADDIFRGYIPCKQGGNCANQAGEKSDKEVGRIGGAIPEGDEREVVDVVPPPPPLEEDEEVVEEDASMCAINQPALDNIFRPRPESENTPYDCSILGCKGGSLIEKDDDGDIRQEEKICNECVSGDKKQKNSGCDDGLFCTSMDGVTPGPDWCIDGKCTGKKVANNDLVGLGQAYDLASLRRKLNGATNTLKQLNSRCEVSQPGFTGEMKMIFVDACCESRKKILRGSRFEGTLGITVPPVQCDFPVGRPWGVIEIGAVAGASVSGEVTGYGTALQGCDGFCDAGIRGSVKLTFKGGIYAALITPDVAKIEGTINAGGNIFIEKKCDEPIRFLDWCIGPPRIEGKVTLGGWWDKTIDYEWEEKKLCSGD